MHVLHVITNLDPQSGGPPRALAGLATAQRKAGMDVSVLATRKPNSEPLLQDRLEQAGVNVEVVGPTRTPLQWHPRIADAATRMMSRADVVHIHAIWEQVQHVAARLAQRKRLPHLIRPCGMLDPWSLTQSPWRKRLYLAWRLRRNLNNASALHFTCEAEHRLTAPLNLQAPAIVEPNGVDLSEFEQLPEPGTFRARHPRLANRPMALFLSRLHHKKGLDLLIPAFARAANNGDAILVIAGPDVINYRPKLDEMIRQNGIEDRVIFTGMLNGNERIEALADADFFVLPSYQENFGVAVVEALAAGTPVIISDQVNIHDRIGAAGVGQVVPTQVEPLTEKIRAWLEDPAQAKAAGDAARSFVWNQHDWNKIASRWQEHYQRLIAQPQPHPD